MMNQDMGIAGMPTAQAIDELKNKKIWLPYNRGVQDGRPTIVPIDAAGKSVGTDNRYCYARMTYAEAMAAKDVLGAAGVGFAILEGYFALEIGHENMEHPYVRLMLDRYNSYTVRTADGTGLCIIGKCDPDRLPVCIDATGRRKLDNSYKLADPAKRLSLYVGGLNNRLIPYSDIISLDRPLMERTDMIRLTLDKDLRKTGKQRYSEARDGDQKTYDLVFQLRNMKTGDKFARLYDHGDLSGYPEHEDADVDLCNLIAYRTGPDHKLIDKVFRTSALYWDSWEDAAYRKSAIDRAIIYCEGQYHQSQMPHPPFIKFREDSGKPYVSAPLLARYVRENLDYLLVRNKGQQGRMTFVYKHGSYKLYSDEMLLGAVKQYIMDYSEELVNMRIINEVVKQLITDDNYIHQSELDDNPEIINFRNCILRVTATETEILPHSPAYRSTIQLACDWTGEPVPTPVFDRFLHILTNGDEEIKQLLLEYMGVCLSNIPGSWLKKVLILQGNGNCGKSPLKRLTERLLGEDNYIGIDLDQIEARFGTGAIYGTRLAGSADMSYKSLKELRALKQITGGDSIMGEHKGVNQFSYVYKGMLWFCCNRLPSFGGDHGPWVYDRLMVVHCPNVIPPEQQDKQLVDKMYAEREGIVYKVIQALQTVIANNYRFSEPESVKLAREEYMIENDPAVTFFRECMCKRVTYMHSEPARSQNVYDTYRAWYRRNYNNDPGNIRVFQGALMDHLGVNREDLIKSTNIGKMYCNYMLNEEGLKLFNMIKNQIN